MKKYKFTPHTADVRLKLEADTQKELFLAALLGMGNLIKPNSCSVKDKAILKEIIEISASDQTALLIDFLSETLTLSQINKAIYCNATFEKLDEHVVRATLHGYKVDSFDEDIKAVTYHEAQITKNLAGNLETVIVFDI